MFAHDRSLAPAARTRLIATGGRVKIIRKNLELSGERPDSKHPVPNGGERLLLSRAGTSLYPWRHRKLLRRGRPYRRRAELLLSGSSRESPSSPETRWLGRLS
jgi:hypothetical protein